MSARIRVMELVSNFAVEGPGGGAERFATALSRALDPSRFEVSVYALWDFQSGRELNLMRELEARGIRCFVGSVWHGRSPYVSFWRSLIAMRRHLSQNAVDILHSHSQFGDVAAISFKANGRVPAIVRTVHIPFATEWRKSALRRLVLTNGFYPMLFDAEIGVSDPITGRLNRRPLARLLKRSALHICNAVELSRFANRERQRTAQRQGLGIQRNSLAVGTVGRLAIEKGQRYFVQAAERVHRGMPEVRFLIVGDGELEQELREEVRALGLDGIVLFLGRRSQIEYTLAALDLYVQPSLWEGMPTSVMEAMASGLAVVATDIPGHAMLIHDGEDGWLVPARDPEGMAEAILHALKHPERMAEMAQQARRVVSQYDIVPIAAQYETLYKKLALGNSSASLCKVRVSEAK
jgi:glycosyltransferase involved in cell wall biosynthesis